jgi:hypothetical protein
LTVKIRPLTRRDRKHLTGMIRRLSDRLGPAGIADLINADFAAAAKDASEENFSPRLVQVAVDIINKLVENFEREMDEFFSSLLSCTVEELDAMPLNIDLEVVLAIVESEEGRDFFTSALRLRNLITEWSGQLSPKKTA